MNFIRNHHKNKSDRINSTTDTEHMFRSLNDHIHTLKVNMNNFRILLLVLWIVIIRPIFVFEMNLWSFIWFFKTKNFDMANWIFSIKLLRLRSIPPIKSIEKFPWVNRKNLLSGKYNYRYNFIISSLFSIVDSI